MTANATINVSVSNHYREPTYASEITSQGVLGEQVEIVEFHPAFSRIRQLDGYQSWISTDQLCRGDLPRGTDIMVRSHFVRIYSKPSTAGEGVRDGVIGCTLRAVDEQGEWFRVFLPDGVVGWLEKRHCGGVAEFTREGIVSLAREFLGYQYCWGGRSPKGFDCSGFVQTVFKMHGVTLPRDSWQQQQSNRVSSDFREAKPADLLFFARTPERVTHVAIGLGNGRFIHASGWVRYNSLRQTDADFSEHHRRTFVSVNRYDSKGIVDEH